MATRRLPERILCLVTDIDRAGGVEPMLKTIDAAMVGGANMLQVRAHELRPKEFASFASAAIETVAGRALCMLNGPIETAREAGADGIHLPQTASLVSVEERRGLVVGQSVHSANAAGEAVSGDIDYLIVGTLFPSKSHPQGKTGGTKLVKDISEIAPTPLIGIGGIAEQNAQSVIDAGACGVAVIGAIIEASDPVNATRRMANAIGL